ncbi:MFS transporter [Corynebacterium epidermidicanis]|uniref:Major Facilitator Superfamily transporter n=1 Tax=Corynebacterium epidermidicanis TaxID=1050174 RepID=A0A0G3GPE8_9CORY|nr:MFS transporter [Corynebacterium epidermidicanis]AKK02455.1 hypothetical protein CEPID_02875 [Corynebacterium epidermidicanis]
MSSNKRLPLLLSNVLDGFAGQLFTLTLELICINQLNFSGTQLAILNVSSLAIFLSLNIFAGLVADRLNIGTSLMLLLFTKLVLFVLFFFSFTVFGLSFHSIFIYEALIGVIAVFLNNSQLVASISLPDDISKTSLASLIASGDQVARILSPLILMFSIHGNHYSLVLQFVIFAAFLGFLTALPLWNLHTGDIGVQTRKTTNRSNFTQGFRIISKSPQLSIAVAVMIITNFGLAMGDLTASLLLLRHFSLPPSQFTFLTLWCSAWGLVTALVAPRLITLFHYIHLIFMCIFAELLSPVTYLLALHFSLPVLFIAMFAGFSWTVGVVIVNIVSTDAISRYVDKSNAGVTFGTLRALSMSVVPIGTMFSGLLVDHAGFMIPLTLWACSCLLALFFVFYKGFSMRVS